MNTQRIHRFCLALMVMAMLVRLAGQVEAYLDFKKASAPTLWRELISYTEPKLAPKFRSRSNFSEWASRLLLPDV